MPAVAEERTVSVTVTPTSGSFAAFEVKIDGKVVLANIGGEDSVEKKSTSRPTVVAVYARGTARAKFECTIKFDEGDDEHEEKKHTLDDFGIFRETIQR